ncbi:ADP-ribosylglycohydrolase family protein [Polyplosphaeria fusca]|uniref:ADP-ribosylhydrolase ARH3 n=1 Tax=Polyplosphaeria fusca TaxID=682080 RepID=A0A9P4UVZ2_9PLEO|nr:ADP-ribosylglycohydrolase family protein [Polyplosphaeria fusca]
MDSRLSKTLGALLGVHAGDSLGATFEFKPWRRIKATHPNGSHEIKGGGAFKWPAGHATDDTDLTRAVLLAYHDAEKARSTVGKEIGGSTAFDVTKAAADYSLQWIEGEWPGREKGSPPVDVGNATQVGLTEYRRTKDVATCGAGPGAAGNGSLMRCIPTGLFAPTKERRREESMAISAFTHNDTRCTVTCAIYNEMVAALISGKSPAEAVQVGEALAAELGNNDVEKALERAKTMSPATLAEEGPGEHKFGGFVLDSLMLAIAALLDARSLEDVLVDVVRVGGDTDTNAAIAGGLLGARDGIEAIPQRWLSKLQFGREFEQLATEIVQWQSG